MAAHITAASPGGPRYDSLLSQAERTSPSNGIWTCQTCGKLIDSDEPGFPTTLLRHWKEDAEHIARQMLTAGVSDVPQSVELSVPSLNSAESLLSFANDTVGRVGRQSELAELISFLEDDPRLFSWWLWTGPAGVGKSRLALELCNAVQAGWRAGFLREGTQERLGRLRPLTATLVVVDYAAQRGGWLSDAIFQLTQHDPGAPVRVLILEREAAGPWWNSLQRAHRFEEASHVANAQYAEPRALSGLSGEHLRELIKGVATELHTPLTSTELEDIADHARHIDPMGRPLFALVATLDWLNTQGVSAGRDQALHRLVDRAQAQLVKRIVESPFRPKALNVWYFSTALGGLEVAKYADMLATTATPVALLPNVSEVLSGIELEELLNGLRPDILGELFVLDRLATNGAERFFATELLKAAWKADPEAYKAFVARATADHGDHPRLDDLLDVLISDRAAWAWLAADMVPLLRRSDHPLITGLLSALTELRDDPSVAEAYAEIQFRRANLVSSESDFERANLLYTEALTVADPVWPVYARILNNRGTTWRELRRQDLELADYTLVIDSTVATDEARACALNNRADIYASSDLYAAIADRTAVLALAHTSYNRRYIALSRRASSWLALGETGRALTDLDLVLATPDIAVEQKMSARLQRAAIYESENRSSEALDDLRLIVESRRNFPKIEEEARVLLERVES